MAGNSVVNFHPPDPGGPPSRTPSSDGGHPRRSDPLRGGGRREGWQELAGVYLTPPRSREAPGRPQWSPCPTTGREKSALMQTLRVCVRPPGGGAPLAPAGSVPVRRMAPDREGHPALPNPPRPPLRVDRAAAQLGSVWWSQHMGRQRRQARGPQTQYALPPATRVTRPLAASRRAGARPSGAPAAASAKARRTLAAGQSPAMGMAGDAEELGARPAASRVVLCPFGACGNP